MELMTIPVNYFDVIINLTWAGVIFFLIFKYCQETISMDSGDAFFSLIKGAGYLTLAWYIKTVYKNLEVVDILTFFTYMLAVFEGAHTLLNSIGIWIVAVVRSITS